MSLLKRTAQYGMAFLLLCLHLAWLVAALCSHHYSNAPDQSATNCQPNHNNRCRAYSAPILATLQIIIK